MFGEINVFYLLLVIYLLIFVISYILAAKKKNRSKMTEVAFVSIFVCVLFFYIWKDGRYKTRILQRTKKLLE